MEMDSYTEKTTPVLEWIESNDDLDEAMGSVLIRMVEEAPDNDKGRKKAWNGIRAVLAILPGAPISQRGSNCPVRAYLDTRADSIDAADTAVFEAYGDLLFKHGKAGGGNFDNVEEYLEYCQNTRLARLRKKQSAEEWSIPDDS
jgi:hypothetical protein